MIRIFGKLVETGLFSNIFFVTLPIFLYMLLGLNFYNDYLEYIEIGTDISKHKLYVNILIHLTFSIMFLYAILRSMNNLLGSEESYLDEEDLFIISSNINKFIFGLIFLEITYFSYLI